MTDYYQNPIAVIVGPIGNIQIAIDSCEDIDLSCGDTFAPEGYDPCNQADHDEILIDLLSEEFNSHVYHGGIDLGDWSENGVEVQDGWR